MIVSHHTRTREQFRAALAEAIAASGLTPRTLTIHAGQAVYPLLLRSEEDGAHMTLEGIGWLHLVEDVALDDWSVEVRKA